MGNLIKLLIAIVLAFVAPLAVIALAFLCFLGLAGEVVEREEEEGEYMRVLAKAHHEPMPAPVADGEEGGQA